MFLHFELLFLLSTNQGLIFAESAVHFNLLIFLNFILPFGLLDSTSPTLKFNALIEHPFNFYLNLDRTYTLNQKDPQFKDLLSDNQFFLCFFFIIIFIFIFPYFIKFFH